MDFIAESMLNNYREPVASDIKSSSVIGSNKTGRLIDESAVAQKGIS